ncbi:MAG: divalent-cation tolerance protein CutA [Candidatus Heimdallarchaeota archaeon]
MRTYIFFVTVPNLEEGKELAKILVESRIAACVNIIQNIFSIYRWKGKIEENNEHLLLIKTNEINSKQLIEKVNDIHSYDTPECIGIKIDEGTEKYLNWINESIK